MGLSIAVQALQEIYKFLTTSKARAYRKSLHDFPHDTIGDDLKDVEIKDLDLAGLLMRGPFQWLEKQRPAHLLPMDWQGLIHAPTKTASEHVGHGQPVFA